ncbi:hypothetical protein QFC22_006196 [Naganishia vaughanmartiniae]|uniref:Uncharacterized protein n=1 Tax=Naganishia vaughanmartiniae TaxID=1424756 RepID=A0ACC2WNH2_9TREE|nr:hypothetical protein QFC22_006196 [Naganishia vaughanmartiniae]
MSDDLTDDSGKGYEDCHFRTEGVSLPMELFRTTKARCLIDVQFKKEDVMDVNLGKPGDQQDFTIAPIAYEKWYRSMREEFSISKFPDMWCKGDEKSSDCLFSNTRAFFSHATYLELTETLVSKLSDSELLTVVNASITSPVFLKDANNIAIITALTPDNKWEGFDISDPLVVPRKTWSAADVKTMSIAYAMCHGSLPFNATAQACASPSPSNRS